MKKYTLGVLLLSVFLSAFTFVSAAETKVSTDAFVCPTYGQNMVDLSVTLPSDNILAGTSMPVTLKLKNISGLPLSGGSVMVRLIASGLTDKILTKAKDSVFVRTLPLTNLLLSKDEARTVSVDISFPASLPQGKYTLDVAYVLNDGFNKENPDLSIADKSGANTVEKVITIKNANPLSIVYFDAATLKKADGDKVKPISSSVDIVNPSTKAVSVPVAWKVYRWDAGSEKNLVSSFVETVELAAESRKNISYSVSDSNYSLYQVVVQANVNDISPMITFSVERPVGEAMVNFVSIGKIGSIGNGFVIGCVQNAFANDKEIRTVMVTVSNPQGKPIERAVFKINPGSKFEFTKDFSFASKEYIVETLIASEAGKIIGRTKQTFTCTSFGGNCVPETAKTTTKNNIVTTLFALTVLTAGTGGLIAVRFYLKRKKLSKFNR
ncbi:MAG: hypothetical protein RLZZ67_276 [Candidatus Parcubacteria bacterium]|jgi:hypothetical protein